MLKVFLVEDEFIIREAIKKTVDWQAAGCELVGEAGDGEKAYQQILKTEPDILITDIRMPFMDGLQLSRLVRRKLPKTRIVILSGFDDFSYAREAITIGVNEYLLKPVSGAKLLETLTAIGTRIEEDRRLQNYKEIYEAEHAERVKYEKQNFVKALIDGHYQMAEALELGAQLGVQLSAELYSVVLMQVYARDGRGRLLNGDGGIVDAMATLTDMAEQLPYLGLYEQIGGVLCLLVTAQSEEQMKERVQEEVSRAMGILGSTEDRLFFASIGRPTDRISGIHRSYDDAVKHFARRFLCDNSRIFSYEDAEEERATETQSEDNAFSLTGFDLGQIDRRVIQCFLAGGSEGETAAFVDSCFSGLSANNLNSQIVRQYVVMDLYLATASFLKELEISPEEIEQAIGKLKNPAEFRDIGETRDYLEEMFLAAIRTRNRLSEAGYSSIVAEAKTYIYKHFEEHDISLSSVAEAVGVSPNHLSRLFSQETETTFVEFLTGVRMDKAKNLLLATQIPSSEIGLRVGYADPHYFYYLFKKTQGRTPKEFRQSGGR